MTDSSDKRPRELWITDDGAPTFEIRISTRPVNANSIRVIEYSAYERLEAENARLTESLDGRWREKYYDKCTELNASEARIAKLEAALRVAQSRFDQIELAYDMSDAIDQALDSGEKEGE